MKIHVGDMVSFLNAPLHGTVTQILEKDQVVVELEDGMEMPVHVREIVKASKHFNAPKINSQPPEIPKPVKEFSEAVYAAASMKDNENVEIHIINNTPHEVLFALYARHISAIRGVERGILGPYSFQKAAGFEYSDLDSWKVLQFKCIFFQKNNATTKNDLNAEMKLKDQSLLHSHEEIPMVKAKGIIQKLENAQVPATSNMGNGVVSAYKVDKPGEVVDLHENKLPGNAGSKTGILEYQLSYCRQMLEEAVASNMPHIIFIHGIGNGILRKNITKMMKEHPYVEKMEEADAAKYGYGAMRVILKNN